MPLVRYLPGAHPTHPAPAMPAGHFWHAALPLPAVFSPAPQLWHAVASEAGENVCCAQTEQCACPSMLLALPGIHGKHDAEPLSGW